MLKITDQLTRNAQVIEHPQLSSVAALAIVKRNGDVHWTGMTPDEMDALALDLLAASALQRAKA